MVAQNPELAYEVFHALMVRARAP